MGVRGLFATAAVGACLLLPSAANADPWKDESGHGRRPSPPSYYPLYGPPPVYVAPPDIRVTVPLPPPPYPAIAYPRRSYDAMPPGHLPPPGECRRWRRGVPAGHQPPPHPC